MSNQATLIEIQQLWWLLKECKLVWAGGSIHQSISHTCFLCIFFYSLITFLHIFLGLWDTIAWYKVILKGRKLSSLRENGGVNTKQMEESSVFSVLGSFHWYFHFCLPSQILCHQGGSSALKTKSGSGRWSWFFWFSGWLLCDAANHRQSQN